MESERYRFDELTWPEVRDAARRDPPPVILLPVGTVEQHGPHLPLKVDNFLASSVCEAAARRAPGEMLVMPCVSYGFNVHHLDFPGTIHIEGDHLVEYVLDITRSLAAHGFKRILIVDGHGSNVPFLEVVARRTVVETDALCASFIYPVLARDAISRVRQSEAPGGMAHACELETSLFLYLEPHSVRREEVRREMGHPVTPFHWMDLIDGPPIQLTYWWSTFSESGVMGDPTLATAHKGEVIFEAVVEQLVRLARTFRTQKVPPRKDHH
ncbi:MAG: creatininase family protein [Armatimonadota bacterium]|nr:creatininase family protein [Armatimonadota bacterium]